MKRIALSTTTVLLASAAALAQPGPGILALDEDGDGLVSREEFRLPEERQGRGPLAQADGDGDGVISRAEMEAAVDEAVSERGGRMRKHASERFAALDSDGDGFVTQQEMADHAFARVDADGDGYVSEEEARALRWERQGRRGGPRAGDRPFGGA